MKFKKVEENEKRTNLNEKIEKFTKTRESEREKQVVREVLDDFLRRKKERSAVERSWLLNMNFLVGNQFSYITPSGEIAETDRRSVSESREVFNHIAPIVESRLAKLGRVRPTMGVRPASPAENDLETAKLSKKILESVSNSLDISNVVSDATLWSEVTGTAFYKVVWDDNLGRILGYKTVSGEVLDRETVEKYNGILPEIKEKLYSFAGSCGKFGKDFNFEFVENKNSGSCTNERNAVTVNGCGGNTINNATQNGFCIEKGVLAGGNDKPRKMLVETESTIKNVNTENENISNIGNFEGKGNYQGGNINSKTTSESGRFDNEKFEKMFSKSVRECLEDIKTELGLDAKIMEDTLKIVPDWKHFLLLHHPLEPIYEGDVSVSVCSPFEIFPDNVGVFELSDQPSIIQAKAVDVSEIKALYGVDALGESINSVSLMSCFSENFFSGKSNVKKVLGEMRENQALVIERWVKPSVELPMGRLTIVAGDKLVFDGDMPYEKYPFIKQVSNRVVGDFWGVSVVERCIPIQRAYNAVKNRKLECIGRLCGGVLAVEEGSVDLDDLETDGLTAGKVLVYRSGSNIPHFMDAGSVPRELSEEEERLSNELISISGVSELMRNSSLPSQVNSGTAINLLIEQDDTRLSVTAENIRTAMLGLSKLVLLLYKKYAECEKLGKITDECGRLQVFYWSKSDITSDDIVLETSNELNESLASRKQMVLELLKYGILQNDEGRLTERTKSKVIEMLGFGNWESGADESALQISRAKMENVTAGDVSVLEIDNHELHIKEHTKYLLERFDGDTEKQEKILNHIREHKEFLKFEKQESV